MKRYKVIKKLSWDLVRYRYYIYKRGNFWNLWEWKFETSFSTLKEAKEWIEDDRMCKVSGEKEVYSI